VTGRWPRFERTDAVGRSFGWLLLFGSDGERHRPVLTRSAVDGQSPLVATRLERQRRRVDRNREVERRPRLETGRTADLELTPERHNLIGVFLVAVESDRYPVRVEELDGTDEVAIVEMEEVPA